MNKIMLPLVAITALALAGCSQAGATAPTADTTPSATLPTKTSQLVVARGETIQNLALGPEDCEDYAEGIRDNYDYVAICGDSHAIALELSPNAVSTGAHQEIADTFKANDMAGWWAIGSDWMVLSNEADANIIAEMNDGTSIHTDGDTVILEDGEPIQYGKVSSRKAEDRLDFLTDTVGETMGKSCSTLNFELGQGEIESVKCPLPLGDGHVNVAVFKDVDAVNEATEYLFEFSEYMEFDYFVIVGENWAIYNLDRADAKTISKIVGEDYVELKDWTPAKS